MHLNVDLHLSTLRCLQPDESEEEPYLWTFFFQLDGSTIRQLQPDTFQLVGNIHIAAGAGGQGNLSSSTASSGQLLRIPANVGAHRTTLRPIRLQVLGQTIVIPGRLLALCILMEHDSTDNGAMLKAHAALTQFLELRWNQFITSELSQDAVTQESVSVLQAHPELAGRGLILAAVQNLIGKFVDELEDQAQGVVEFTVILDSDAFELVYNAIDSDNSMGTQRLAFDERQIIGAGFQIPIHAAIIRTEDGKWTAYHQLYGNLYATLTADNNELVAQTALRATVRLDGGRHVFQDAFLCIEPGTAVEWTLNACSLEQEIRFAYPFVDIRWSIGDILLAPAAGTAEFGADCGFPQFDPSQPPRLLGSRHARRQVKVRYEIQYRGDEDRILRLWNAADDGNYSFIVDAVAVAANGMEIELGSTMVTFTGQRVDLGPPPFMAAFNQCLEQITSLGERYAKSKRVTARDLWDPHARFKAYEELIEVVDSLLAVRKLSQTRATSIKQAIAMKLQVKVDQ